MKSYEEIMEILEAFDLTGSLRDAAELAGCSHHTVGAWVARRDAGELPEPGQALRRPRIIDAYLDKIEEWVERSGAKVRADVVADKLAALGFVGSERTVRRAVAEAKAHYRVGRRRVYRPWIPEPGMWAQWDWGDGPLVRGRRTLLFCAWLAWCRFRVVIPVWDRRMPTLVACLDRAMRAFGGAPTYWLTDNERTVSIDHVAGIAVRNPAIVAVGAHYGITIATCLPADPESKGGVESTVRIAKADLVPTEANLLPAYRSFAELEAAAAAFMEEVNSRVHRVTRRAPIEALGDEQARLHRLPEAAYTAAFGQTRRVSDMATVSFGGVTYSVPHLLVGQVVWVRVEGDEVILTHTSGRGAVEVARHVTSVPGVPRINDEHYPPRPEGPLERRARPTNPAEEAFVSIGEGARLWLAEAAAAGTVRIRVKMADAVALAALHGADAVDRALGQAAMYGRFAEGDLASILGAQRHHNHHRADESHSLQEGTRAWEGFGQ